MQDANNSKNFAGEKKLLSPITDNFSNNENSFLEYWLVRDQPYFPGKKNLYGNTSLISNININYNNMSLENTFNKKTDLAKNDKPTNRNYLINSIKKANKLKSDAVSKSMSLRSDEVHKGPLNFSILRKNTKDGDQEKPGHGWSLLKSKFQSSSMNSSQNTKDSSDYNSRREGRMFLPHHSVFRSVNNQSIDPIVNKVYNRVATKSNSKDYKIKKNSNSFVNRDEYQDPKYVLRQESPKHIKKLTRNLNYYPDSVSHIKSQSIELRSIDIHIHKIEPKIILLKKKNTKEKHLISKLTKVDDAFRCPNPKSDTLKNKDNRMSSGTTAEYDQMDDCIDETIKIKDSCEISPSRLKPTHITKNISSHNEVGIK